MNNFWQDCLAQIKAMKLPPMIITNWFEPIELVRWDSERGDMVLEAPASKVQTIRATYLKTIQDVAVHLYGGQVKVTLQAVGALAGDVQTPAQPKGPSSRTLRGDAKRPASFPASPLKTTSTATPTSSPSRPRNTSPLRWACSTTLSTSMAASVWARPI